MQFWAPACSWARPVRKPLEWVCLKIGYLPIPRDKQQFVLFNTYCKYQKKKVNNGDNGNQVIKVIYKKGFFASKTLCIFTHR